jgi:hypothetical protein
VQQTVCAFVVRQTVQSGRPKKRATTTPYRPEGLGRGPVLQHPGQETSVVHHNRLRPQPKGQKHFACPGFANAHHPHAHRNGPTQTPCRTRDFHRPLLTIRTQPPAGGAFRTGVPIDRSQDRPPAVRPLSTSRPPHRPRAAGPPSAVDRPGGRWRGRGGRPASPDPHAAGDTYGRDSSDRCKKGGLEGRSGGPRPRFVTRPRGAVFHPVLLHRTQPATRRRSHHPKSRPDPRRDARGTEAAGGCRRLLPAARTDGSASPWAGRPKRPNRPDGTARQTCGPIPPHGARERAPSGHWGSNTQLANAHHSTDGVSASSPELRRPQLQRAQHVVALQAHVAGA